MSNDLTLFDFNAEHNGVQCIASLRPEDRGTERQFWFTAKMLCEIFEIARKTLEDNIQSLSDDGEFSMAKFRHTEKVPASDGKLYDTTIYNLEVLNKLGMCCFRHNKKAKEIRNKFNDVLVNHETGVRSADDVIELMVRDPNCLISMIQQCMYERQQKELAIKQRDEAIRTKCFFVEGRDAKVCGENGGLHTQNEKLRAQIGDAKNWKQVKAIPWLRDIFVDCAGTYSQVGKALTKICRENDWEIRKTESSDNQPFNVYPIKAVNLLKKRLDADKNMLNKWRKQEA